MSAKDEQVGGSHYKDMPFPPGEYCQVNGLKFWESCAIKHISRHGKKGGKAGGLQDLKKAQHEIQLVIDMEYQDVNEEQDEYLEPDPKHQLDTLITIMAFIEDTDKANALIYAIQQGQVPAVKWEEGRAKC